MSSDYNTAPEGLIEIPLEEWANEMFHYCIKEADSRHVIGEQIYDLRMWDVPNFDGKKLGLAVMRDWFDKETGKAREKYIIRFCRYGLEEDWRSFKSRFAAQFAGDNS